MGLAPKLLFVDEGPAWLADVRARLAEDYDVVAVETGPQALSMLEATHIAVLITDNHLASVQDRRFGQTLKHHHAMVPRIVLAERPEIEMAITERNGNRVDAALPKPCAGDDLSAIVDRLLGEATVRDNVIREAITAAPPRPQATSAANSGRVDRETQPDPFDAASGDDG